MTIVERDALEDSHEARKGVPQGRHAHGLLARGSRTLEQMFPGFGEEILAEGANRSDIVNECLWYNFGCALVKTKLYQRHSLTMSLRFAPSAKNLFAETREHLFQRAAAARQQTVSVASLRNSLTRLMRILECVALDDGHVVIVVAERARGQQAADAGADHDRTLADMSYQNLLKCLASIAFERIRPCGEAHASPRESL